jgi:hypothetical protein
MSAAENLALADSREVPHPAAATASGLSQIRERRREGSRPSESERPPIRERRRIQIGGRGGQESRGAPDRSARGRERRREGARTAPSESVRGYGEAPMGAARKSATKCARGGASSTRGAAILNVPLPDAQRPVKKGEAALSLRGADEGPYASFASEVLRFSNRNAGRRTISDTNDMTTRITAGVNRHG